MKPEGTKNTLQKRSFGLELSNADYRNLCEKAAMAGMSADKLLENFVMDLVDGTYTNGSDERMYADMWFERCGFSMFPEHTFLRYLIMEGRVEEILKLYDDMGQTENHILSLEKELETGIMIGRNGESYTWEDVRHSNVDKNNIGWKPAYSSKEEWEIEQREELAHAKEELQEMQGLLDSCWNGYLGSSDEEGHGTMEEELKKVRAWKEKVDFQF